MRNNVIKCKCDNTPTKLPNELGSGVPRPPSLRTNCEKTYFTTSIPKNAHCIQRRERRDVNTRECIFIIEILWSALCMCPIT